MWETNRASFPIIVKGVVQTPAVVEKGIADRLLCTEVDGVLWGDRRVYFTYIHGELVLKAEVASAAEVECMIRNRIMVEGTKCEVRAWTRKMHQQEKKFRHEILDRPSDTTCQIFVRN